MTVSVASTKEALASAFGELGSWVSLHTGDPGFTGASEASGGTPAYSRKPTNWLHGDTDGVITGTAVVIDAPAGVYTHIGIWSTPTGGTFVAGVAISDVTLSEQGQVILVPSFTQT